MWSLRVAVTRGMVAEGGSHWGVVVEGGSHLGVWSLRVAVTGGCGRWGWQYAGVAVCYENLLRLLAAFYFLVFVFLLFGT